MNRNIASGLPKAYTAIEWGIAATVKVGKLQREKRYLPDTPLKAIKGWQDETRVALRKIARTA